MPVSLSRSGNTLTVTVTVDVSDIRALVGVSPAEQKVRALERADAEFRKAMEANQSTDADLDKRATDAAAAVAALKAARPTGSL